MERKSIAYADILFSPTQYMISWAADQGWELPERSYVQPHILPDGFIAEASPETGQNQRAGFFRQTAKTKGPCSVLRCPGPHCKKLQGSARAGDIFGQAGDIGGRTSEEYIRERARQWPFSVRIISDLDRDGALAYLKEGGRLAIIASLIENFGHTVQECCGMGIPFLASAGGGNTGPRRPEDRERICFVPRPRELARRIVEALEEGCSTCKVIDRFQIKQRGMDKLV